MFTSDEYLIGTWRGAIRAARTVDLPDVDEDWDELARDNTWTSADHVREAIFHLKIAGVQIETGINK